MTSKIVIHNIDGNNDRTISKLHNGIQLDGKSMTPDTTAVTVYLADQDGNVLLAKGADVPSDAETGFAKGCIFIQTDGGIGTTIYANDGDEASADFNAGAVGATGDITSIVTASGSGLSGGVTSGAATLTVVVDDSTIEISTNTIQVKDAGITPANTNIVQARTATSDGTGTGVVSATATHVTVTSANATDVITLPAPVAGRVLTMDVGANGFKLQSSTPASIAINGGTGASAKSTIAANSTLYLICVSATAWKGFFLDADSDLAKIAAAA